MLKKIGITTKLEFYIIPVVIFLFAVNFHFFQWYRDSYSRTAAFFKSVPIQDHYERIQSQHPYYQIYKLAQKYKGQEDRVHFVFHFRGDDNLDYVSTYYANLNNPDPKRPKEIHMRELGLFLNYFFYPQVIKPISVDDLQNVSLKPGEVIVSDIDLFTIPPDQIHPKTVKKLAGVTFDTQIVLHKEALIPNRRPEDIYFIYTVR